MKQVNRWIVAVLVAVGLQLMACQSHHAGHHAEHPAEVEKVPGTDVSKVTLTEMAMKRIAVETAQVSEQSGQKTVPYSSLIYDPKGQTWVYTSPQPRTFVRQKVEVNKINGDTAVLQNGPPAGTMIASVGVAELYGTEFKVGH